MTPHIGRKRVVRSKSPTATTANEKPPQNNGGNKQSGQGALEAEINKQPIEVWRKVTFVLLVSFLGLLLMVGGGSGGGCTPACNCTQLRHFMKQNLELSPREHHDIFRHVART